MHHHHRRRKKRPNYGTRTVDVSRGFNGFGFTISGQQPCILSCIVTNSPADQAGLRAGDFLISVNGLNVSKLPHEAVVQLIGNSLGTIRMQIAENYFSDSSDEENIVSHMNRVKPRYLHNKLKMNRIRNSPQKVSRSIQANSGLIDQALPLCPVIEDAPPPVAHNIIHSPNASTSKDISNVSAMVRKTDPEVNASPNGSAALEYRAIVGYLGTIEMPKQIATSSKLQTVRSCIRKMRQEKRNPTTVLMTILPNCLTLRNSSASMLATYPSSRLNYVSSSSESENRFFGLVTSAIYASIDDDPIPVENENLLEQQAARDVIISNSCHVFVVDTKICEHSLHEPRAAEFKIACTKDPISNLCLEFPNNSEYVVNLIRSMYTMKVLPPCSRNMNGPNLRPNEMFNNGRHQENLQANSPQPSNHSEVTTTSSNSDSGIGFHNDCTNISDRILVVDFPGLMVNRAGNILSARPHAICNNIEPAACENIEKPLIPVHVKSKSADFNTRLTVRAMPDPKVTISPHKSEIPDLLAAFGVKNNQNPLTSTRSCDDVISSVERNDMISKEKKQLQMSMDDITMLSGNASSSKMQEHVFIEPRKPSKIAKKIFTNCKEDENGMDTTHADPNLVSYKLSPKVFGLSKPNSTSYQDLSQKIDNNESESTVEAFEIWGSLQDLHKSGNFEHPTGNFLEGTFSEPDLASRALPSSASPFRRWGQSSFRTPKTTDCRHQLARRPSSLAASENDVYTKSMDDFNVDLNAQFSRSGDLSAEPSALQETERAGVTAWGSSFEKLLEDLAGIHTFAEFLKKEFSAENIYFWTACERYRRTESTTERAAQAMDIFSKHLANGAPEPVNVDSQARNTAEDNLQTADRNLFNQAQKQIFNLMKFDSYQRFIRSDLYKRCIEAESKNQPLPYPGDKLDELLRTTPESPGPSKLKKSASNAEDRHRKSLLPWHRKTRCKSKDRTDTDINSNKSASKSQSCGNSLKPPATNSTSDIHSSRSSLSSFDATVAAAIGSGQEDAKAVSLCRVILCDGATTIVQTRPNETVRQLVERLLEKRGIHYQFFDVMISGNSKAIDLECPATMLAGKEVQIEQRVAFKLDLPDPKVISVKSKPKKALCDVLKPILHKYNYRLEDVQVLLRETHEQLDMTLPVTVADGQRLQVVMIRSEGIRPEALQQQQQHHKHRANHIPSYQNQTCLQLPKNPSFPTNMNKPITQQSTLDEITNKVFNELLQGKVESHANQGLPPKPSDQCSLRSEDCASESSSIFERLRRKDSNIPALKVLRPKKTNDLPNKCPTVPSDDAMSLSTQNTSVSDPTSNGIKKPLIAKWKTGVKLQVTGRAENHEEFLEGLKRAQRARLEDQRGTEINSELPDFLKDKENLSVASKLRKVRANLSPIGSASISSGSIFNDEGLSTSTRNNFDTTNVIMERPQPAPRLSIAKNNGNTTISPVKVEINGSEILNDRNHQNNNPNEGEFDPTCRGPPPLPPKPKILPIKPSNWGQNSSLSCSVAPSKIPVDISRRHLAASEPSGRSVYLDQPSSSFV